jgi:4-hydroxythreonine-4-phosphate dehydrogenase
MSLRNKDNDTLLPKHRPRLALTMGDPAGIGPEVILKALADPGLSKNFDVTVVGSHDLLSKIYAKVLVNGNLVPLANPENLSVADVPLEETIKSEIVMGMGNAASGAASFAYLEWAIARTKAGEFDAIVTAPVAKSAWKAAGYDYPGQTELLAAKSGTQKFAMLFVARSPRTGWTLRCLLATTHIPLCQVPKVLTAELMTQKLELLVNCLQKDFGIENGKIAIAGLNPHSGEQGQLGTEEQDWLIPWLEQERRKHQNWQLDGPIPPDTMWIKPARAWYEGIDASKVADAYLALYHDQGLIPVKLMAFDTAVNTTIGLPFIRTSPDHGTAFDIAGRGIANATSMKAAIELAAQLSNIRLAKSLNSL